MLARTTKYIDDFSPASSMILFFFAFLGQGVDVWSSPNRRPIIVEGGDYRGLQLYEKQALAEKIAHTFQKMDVVVYVWVE